MSVDTLLKVKNTSLQIFSFQTKFCVFLLLIYICLFIFQLDEDKLISGSYDGVIRSNSSSMFLSLAQLKQKIYCGCDLFILINYLIF